MPSSQRRDIERGSYSQMPMLPALTARVKRSLARCSPTWERRARDIAASVRTMTRMAIKPQATSEMGVA